MKNIFNIKFIIKNLFNQVDTMSKLRNQSLIQQSKSEIQFRIIAKSIKSKDTQIKQPSRWKLYLQKGMQVLGQTVVFLTSSEKNQYEFSAKENMFDFQIASDKGSNSLNYAWSLYKLDDNGYEERVLAQSFSIRQYYTKYETQNSRDGYQITIPLKNLFIYKFKLLIQNSSTSIIQLVSSIVPQSAQQVAKALSAISKRSNEANNKNKQKQIQQKQQSKNVDKQNAKQVSSPLRQARKPDLKNKNNIPEQKQSDISQRSQQKQKQAPQSINRNVESKYSARNSTQNLNLQPITQDRQKQDKFTPNNRLSRFNRPGSVHDALAQFVNKNQINQQAQQPSGSKIQKEVQNVQVAQVEAQQTNIEHQQPLNNAEQPNQGGNEQQQPNLLFKYKTPGEQERQQIVQIIQDPESGTLEQGVAVNGQGQREENKQITEEKIKSDLKKSLKLNTLTPQIQQPSSSGRKFKIAIIVILLLILFGGVIGSFMSGKTKKIKQQPKVKTYKKGKKNIHVKQKKVKVKLS